MNAFLQVCMCVCVNVSYECICSGYIHAYTIMSIHSIQIPNSSLGRADRHLKTPGRLFCLELPSHVFDFRIQKLSY